VLFTRTWMDHHTTGNTTPHHTEANTPRRNTHSPHRAGVGILAALCVVSSCCVCVFVLLSAINNADEGPTATRKARHGFRYFEPSFQSSFHPSITLLVRYRSRAEYSGLRGIHLAVQTAVPSSSTRRCRKKGEGERAIFNHPPTTHTKTRSRAPLEATTISTGLSPSLASTVPGEFFWPTCSFVVSVPCWCVVSSHTGNPLSLSLSSSPFCPTSHSAPAPWESRPVTVPHLRPIRVGLSVGFRFTRRY